MFFKFSSKRKTKQKQQREEMAFTLITSFSKVTIFSFPPVFVVVFAKDIFMLKNKDLEIHENHEIILQGK